MTPTQEEVLRSLVKELLKEYVKVGTKGEFIATKLVFQGDRVHKLWKKLQKAVEDKSK